MFPLTEIHDSKNPDRPRIINPANIDQIIPADDGTITVAFHGGSAWTVYNKEIAEEVYQSFRAEIARQKQLTDAQMRMANSRLVSR